MNVMIYAGLPKVHRLRFIHQFDKPIINVVSEHTGISVYDIKSKRRLRRFVEARCIVAYQLRALNRNTLKEIGRLLGGKDHSTVLYWIANYENLFAQDKEFRKLAIVIERDLNGRSGV